MAARRILVIMHQESSTPGRVGDWLRRRGVELDARRPVLGDPLPATMQAHDGVVIFGGPGSVNDDIAHFRAEMDWIAVPLRENKPFLGICLGAQMLAKHLGAPVGPHPEGLCELGYYPVRPTAAGAALCDCWPDHVYEWHTEGFELPAGAELLLEGRGHFPNQGYRYGEKAFAFQFHPEMTTAIIHRWTVKARHMLALPGARPLASHFEDRFIHDPANACWLDRFLDFWLSLAPPREQLVVS